MTVSWRCFVAVGVSGSGDHGVGRDGGRWGGYAARVVVVVVVAALRTTKVEAAKLMVARLFGFISLIQSFTATLVVFPLVQQ